MTGVGRQTSSAALQVNLGTFRIVVAFSPRVISLYQCVMTIYEQVVYDQARVEPPTNIQTCAGQCYSLRFSRTTTHGRTFLVVLNRATFLCKYGLTMLVHMPCGPNARPVRWCLPFRMVQGLSRERRILDLFGASLSL